MREAGLSDEERAKILTERAADIAENPRRVIEELAEKLAERAPKELRDLVAEDLRRGNFGDVNWKLSQIEKYCAYKGGCTPEERRDLYRRL
jgi:phosphoenolpyruvate-protein kinase (PTS system EI component)